METIVDMENSGLVYMLLNDRIQGNEENTGTWKLFHFALTFKN
jgi:hypothetical protein